MFLFGLFAVFGFLCAWCFLVVCGVVLPPFFVFTPVELHHTAIALRTQEASAVSASPAVIRIASKHLHNDLARAIEKNIPSFWHIHPQSTVGTFWRPIVPVSPCQWQFWPSAMGPVLQLSNAEVRK